jgi:flavin-dependent dehydrogenase
MATTAVTAAPQFDAIVIGAGPAGSAAAILLARAGWAVALVERQAFPRRKVCGACIAASNLPLLVTLGIGAAFDAVAGPALRQVTLLRGDGAVTAELPAAATATESQRWGRALGRETLDALLLDQARAAGAQVLQPWAVQGIQGSAGAWHCQVRAMDTATVLRLRAPVLIDAHGSWEDLPSALTPRRLARDAGDLFAFKASFHTAALRPGAISVLALDGGYGGMVVADGGLTTVACCVRRDRLSGLRDAAPGLRAGDAVQAWLLRECRGVRQALHGAQRDGPWLASGPLAPGVRVSAQDAMFRIGNAAGEAHPILGEGMSMALQSAQLLCTQLLAESSTPAALDTAAFARIQRRYASAWQDQFAMRLRVAAAFAQLAMRPRGAALLMGLLRHWPGLLTNGARLGGKVRLPRPATAAATALAAGEAGAALGTPAPTHARQLTPATEETT